MLAFTSRSGTWRRNVILLRVDFWQAQVELHIIGFAWFG